MLLFVINMGRDSQSLQHPKEEVQERLYAKMAASFLAKIPGNLHALREGGSEAIPIPNLILSGLSPAQREAAFRAAIESNPAYADFAVARNEQGQLMVVRATTSRQLTESQGSETQKSALPPLPTPWESETSGTKKPKSAGRKTQIPPYVRIADSILGSAQSPEEQKRQLEALARTAEPKVTDGKYKSSAARYYYSAARAIELLYVKNAQGQPVLGGSPDSGALDRLPSLAAIARVIAMSRHANADQKAGLLLELSLDTRRKGGADIYGKEMGGQMRYLRGICDYLQREIANKYTQLKADLERDAKNEWMKARGRVFEDTFGLYERPKSVIEIPQKMPGGPLSPFAPENLKKNMPAGMPERVQYLLGLANQLNAAEGMYRIRRVEGYLTKMKEHTFESDGGLQMYWNGDAGVNGDVGFYLLNSAMATQQMIDTYKPRAGAEKGVKRLEELKTGYLQLEKDLRAGKKTAVEVLWRIADMRKEFDGTLEKMPMDIFVKQGKATLLGMEIDSEVFRWLVINKQSIAVVAFTGMSLIPGGQFGSAIGFGYLAAHDIYEGIRTGDGERVVMGVAMGLPFLGEAMRAGRLGETLMTSGRYVSGTGHTIMWTLMGKGAWEIYQGIDKGYYSINTDLGAIGALMVPIGAGRASKIMKKGRGGAETKTVETKNMEDDKAGPALKAREEMVGGTASKGPTPYRSKPLEEIAQRMREEKGEQPAPPASYPLELAGIRAGLEQIYVREEAGGGSSRTMLGIFNTLEAGVPKYLNTTDWVAKTVSVDGTETLLRKGQPPMTLREGDKIYFSSKTEDFNNFSKPYGLEYRDGRLRGFAAAKKTIAGMKPKPGPFESRFWQANELEKLAKSDPLVQKFINENPRGTGYDPRTGLRYSMERLAERVPPELVGRVVRLIEGRSTKQAESVAMELTELLENYHGKDAEAVREKIVGMVENTPKGGQMGLIENLQKIQEYLPNQYPVEASALFSEIVQNAAKCDPKSVPGLVGKVREDINNRWELDLSANLSGVYGADLAKTIIEQTRKDSPEDLRKLRNLLMDPRTRKAAEGYPKQVQERFVKRICIYVKSKWGDEGLATEFVQRMQMDSVRSLLSGLEPAQAERWVDVIYNPYAFYNSAKLDALCRALTRDGRASELTDEQIELIGKNLSHLPKQVLDSPLFEQMLDAANGNPKTIAESLDWLYIVAREIAPPVPVAPVARADWGRGPRRVQMLAMRDSEIRAIYHLVQKQVGLDMPGLAGLGRAEMEEAYGGTTSMAVKAFLLLELGKTDYRYCLEHATPQDLKAFNRMGFNKRYQEYLFPDPQVRQRLEQQIEGGANLQKLEEWNPGLSRDDLLQYYALQAVRRNPAMSYEAENLLDYVEMTEAGIADRVVDGQMNGMRSEPFRVPVLKKPYEIAQSRLDEYRRLELAPLPGDYAPQSAMDALGRVPEPVRIGLEWENGAPHFTMDGEVFAGFEAFEKGVRARVPAGSPDAKMIDGNLKGIQKEIERADKITDPVRREEARRLAREKAGSGLARALDRLQTQQPISSEDTGQLLTYFLTHEYHGRRLADVFFDPGAGGKGVLAVANTTNLVHEVFGIPFGDPRLSSIEKAFSRYASENPQKAESVMWAELRDQPKNRASFEKNAVQSKQAEQYTLEFRGKTFVDIASVYHNGSCLGQDVEGLSARNVLLGRIVDAEGEQVGSLVVQYDQKTNSLTIINLEPSAALDGRHGQENMRRLVYYAVENTRAFAEQNGMTLFAHEESGMVGSFSNKKSVADAFGSLYGQFDSGVQEYGDPASIGGYQFERGKPLPPPSAGAVREYGEVKETR